MVRGLVRWYFTHISSMFITMDWNYCAWWWKNLPWQISVVLYKFKSWLLIIKPDKYDLSYHRNFLKQPSPLNGMVGGNHRVRWFLDGFWVPPNGCPPSVKRCDAMAHRSSLGGFVGWPLSHEVIHLDKAGQWSFRKDCDIRRWLVRWLATNGACDAFG